MRDIINLETLAEPVFVETEFSNILNRGVQTYEDISGLPLPKDSISRVNLATQSYLEQLQRIDANEVGKQNLLPFSVGKYFSLFLIST